MAINIDTDRIEVCNYFSANEWEKGRKKLFKMYNTQLDKICNIEDIRFIIYNLAWVECNLNNIESARLYIKEIKDIFENNPSYIENYSSHYCKILDVYNASNDAILSVDEKIELYEKTYAIYKKNNSNSLYMALHNIYNLKKQYYKIPKLIKDMLNNIGQNQNFLNDMLDTLERKDNKSYNEALIIINNFKMSNTSVS